MKKTAIYLVVLLGFTGCFKEDDPVDPYVSPGDVETVVAEMGSDYGLQLFYDLGTNQFVKTSHREEWDLAFQAGEGEFHIYLNSAKKMACWNTGQTDFNAVQSDAGAEWAFDDSDGDPAKTAFGEWGEWNGDDFTSHNHVFIIDRGYTVTGGLIGKKKIQLISRDAEKYVIRCANLDGSSLVEMDIPTDGNYNYTFLSLEDNCSIADIEPPKADWDLMFTQYTALVYNTDSTISEQYSVNGVLINSHMVEGAREFAKPFTDIVYTDLENYIFTRRRDIVGYEWKVYNFNTMVYEVDATKIYLIKDVGGFYYKLRFTSFTNDQGEKGYPKFEVGKF